MHDIYYAGIISNGIRTICRLENQNGDLIGTGVDKSANLGYSVSLAWDSIVGSIKNALPADKKNFPYDNIKVCAGIKGTELPEALHSLSDRGLEFNTFKIFSDGELSHLATFRRTPGILVITDEGVVAYAYDNRKFIKYGGWGFPHADEGGTAWIGMQVIRHTLKTADHLEPESRLCKHILSLFHNNPLELCEYAMTHLAPRFFSRFSKIVEKFYASHEPLSVTIIKKGFSNIEELISEIDAHLGKQYPLALSGSLAKVYNDFLPKNRKVNVSQDTTKTAIMILKNEV